MSAVGPDQADVALEEEAYERGLWSRLAPVWRELLAATGESSAFLSDAWMAAWMEVYGPKLRPTGLVWRIGGGAPVGCALASTGPGRFGPFTVTRWFLNASGAGEPGCEHNDVLALPEHREAVLDSVVAVARRSGADEVALVGARDRLARGIQQRWPTQGLEGHWSEAPFVCLRRVRESQRDYLAVLSPNTRSQVRRSLRVYEDRFGAPTLEFARTPAVATEWFGELVSLHEARWQAKGLGGSFAGERSRTFHALLLTGCVEVEDDALAVDIVRLRFGDEPVAYLYNLRHRGTVSFYQSGLRYHDDNRLKPGLVAHALAVQHYLASDAIEYDFLGGEPAAVRYKKSLSTDARMLAWIELPAPSLKMRALSALRRAGRRLRRRRGT